MTNPHPLTALVWEALEHAVSGNGAAAAEALCRIGTSADGHGVYGACCAFAEAGKLTLHQLYGGQIPAEAHWGIAELQSGALAASPPRTFALRFLTAYANGQRDTCLALFNAAINASDDEYVDSVSALLATVGQLGQLALREKDTHS